MDGWNMDGWNMEITECKKLEINNPMEKLKYNSGRKPVEMSSHSCKTNSCFYVWFIIQTEKLTPTLQPTQNEQPSQKKERKKERKREKGSK